MVVVAAAVAVIVVVVVKVVKNPSLCGPLEGKKAFDGDYCGEGT